MRDEDRALKSEDLKDLKELKELNELKELKDLCELKELELDARAIAKAPPGFDVPTFFLGEEKRVFLLLGRTQQEPERFLGLPA